MNFKALEIAAQQTKSSRVAILVSRKKACDNSPPECCLCLNYVIISNFVFLGPDG
ncbi:hypothetical protein JHK87_055601 [Glycine soja]|nr:hypothetical protein JHK87_055601 [Glycine soja]